MGNFKNIIFKYSNPEIMAAMKLLVNALRRYNKRDLGFIRNFSVHNAVLDGPVLIISPHQDDEAIGMGGALLKHLSKGDEITVLYLTDGRYDSPPLGIPVNEMISIRKQEAEAIGKKYKIRQIFWDIEDSKLNPDRPTVLRMVKLLEEIYPRTIYLPSFFDAHYDHFASNAILYDSIKQISLSNVNIMSYEVHDDVLFPNFILEISQFFDQKIELLRFYDTPLKCYDYIKLCRYRNALRYLKYVNHKKEGYAEAYLSLDERTYIDLFGKYFNELKMFKSNLRPLFFM
jgi:LmbE family N-acetylglucosaminyl deacetylase